MVGLISLSLLAFLLQQSLSAQPDISGTEAAVLKDSSIVYRSDDLTIERLSGNVYQHISYLNTDDYGKVSCNGMIIMDRGEAIVFDTPASPGPSAELIAYVTGEFKSDIKAVIPTHFHEDCVAGLDEFNEHSIPIYASDGTLQLFKAKGLRFSGPIRGFRRKLELQVAGKKVYAQYHGAGHTSDNIIGYYPEENALFGGCLVKEMGAGKGNLADADVADWPGTVRRIRQKYPDIEIVIPGHGEWGGPHLLDYTIELFQ
jgi:metallo-beta-lactamase class B